MEKQLTPPQTQGARGKVRPKARKPFGGERSGEQLQVGSQPPSFSTGGDGQRLQAGLQPPGPNCAAAAPAAVLASAGSGAARSSHLKGGASP